MANPNLTDMTEEDAADLQFPKGTIFFFLHQEKEGRRYLIVSNL